jgi:predicted GNAT family acetyltransferase
MSASAQPGSEIVHDEQRRRFVHRRDGAESYLVYHPVDERTVDFASTYTPPALRGRGIAARIVRHALEWAEGEGLKVVPSCWFVAEYVDRQPEWKRILADH